jgi:arginine/ornithine N-succinyltransferase beta subunit
MLKKLGFEYRNQIDPFDGGPHLWAEVEKISPIKKTQVLKWSGTPVEGGDGVAGLLTKHDPKGTAEFRAVGILAQIVGDTLQIQKADPTDIALVEKTLSVSGGDSVLFMPYY